MHNGTAQVGGASEAASSSKSAPAVDYLSARSVLAAPTTAVWLIALERTSYDSAVAVWYFASDAGSDHTTTHRTPVTVYLEDGGYVADWQMRDGKLVADCPVEVLVEVERWCRSYGWDASWEAA